MSEYSNLPFGDTVAANVVLDLVRKILHQRQRDITRASFTIEGRPDQLAFTDAEARVRDWVSKGVPNVRYTIDESDSHEITVDLSARADVAWVDDIPEE